MPDWIADDVSSIAAGLKRVEAEKRAMLSGGSEGAAQKAAQWHGAEALAEYVASLTYGSALMDGSFPRAADA